jgi:hypothetical protein
MENIMTRNERAIAILNYAERDFRLKPTTKLNNKLGLCYYVEEHPLCENLKLESIKKLLGIIGINSTIFIFTRYSAQSYAWKRKYKGYNYERADFCKDKIKELRQ